MLFSGFDAAPTATRASHRGTMGSISELSPFGGPSRLSVPGIRMGCYEDKTEFRLDIHLGKRLGEYEAPIVFVDAAIGKGKTSLAIVACLNASYLTVELNRKFKVMFEISRRNVGVAELDSLVRELNADVVDMATYGINIFDLTFGLTKPELLDAVIETVNFIERRDANTFEVHMYMAALSEYYALGESNAEFKKRASNLQYEKCLATLTFERFKELIAERDEWTDETTSDEGAEVYAPYQHHALTSEDVDVNEEEFLKTRSSCLLTLALLRKGQFGQAFSGKHSLVELFDRTALGIDLTGLNPTTIGLVQTLLWKFKRSAANSTDPERRRRFVFDWEIHDENRDSWLHAPYRREVPQYLKRIRSVNCVMWFNAHRIPGDYVALHDDARNAALSAVSEGTIFFHGYRKDIDARALCEYFQYSKKVERELQRLVKGQFIVRVGANAPQKVQIQLSKRQLELTFSEASSENKTRVSDKLAALYAIG